MMPFDLRNVEQTFQRFLDKVTGGLEICIYLDNILVASRDWSEHFEHLKQLFQRLKDYGLSINLEKCNIGKEQVPFLGHMVTKDGLRTLTNRTDWIKNYPKPDSTKELRRFFGMLNFYHRFLPMIAKILNLLYNLLQNKNPRKDGSIQ